MTIVRRLPATAGFSDRDLGLLAWMGEQYGARLDHVEALANVKKTTAVTLVGRLRKAGFVRTERIIVGHPTWSFPTAAGLAVSGLPYEVWTPTLNRLVHVGAIADVRVHVQAQRSDAQWICERQIQLELPKGLRGGRHIPDGVLILEGHPVAVEVELSPKKPELVEAVLNHHFERFDAILYYCAPQTIRLLTRLEQTGRWPRLAVRELPRPRYLREQLARMERPSP
jgi:hypothetical protein